MAEIAHLAVAGLTLTTAVWAGRRRLGIRTPVSQGVNRALETLGMAGVFFILNVAATAAAVLLLRPLFGFVSLYLAADEVLLILALMEAIIYSHWVHADARRP